MKHSRQSVTRRGFTLIELMVAMTITTIIVSVLVAVTSIALDTWNRSRAEIRASRQAKSLADTMARDFEALVTRKGNNFEWLVADGTSAPVGPESGKSPNATELTFFTSATDRYNGDLENSKGGDVSCVSYRLAYQNPVDGQQDENLSTFVVYRKLSDPDVTFENMLGKEELDSAFQAKFPDSDVTSVENFVCENVYQFTTTFHVEAEQAAQGATPAKKVTVPLTIGTSTTGNSVSSFKIQGTGIETEYSGSLVTDDELKAGRVSAVEISITVLSDFGVDQLRRRELSGTAKADFLKQNSYQFSKLVQLPGM